MSNLPWLLVHGAAVFRMGVGVSALLALAGGALLRRHRSRRAAKKARGRLGAPLEGTRGLEHGEATTLRGRLVVEGRVPQRFEDGGDAAAIGIGLGRGATGLGERAERLFLEDAATGERMVEIVGEVSLVSGSREVWPPRRLAKLPVLSRGRVAELNGRGSRPPFPLPPAAPITLRSVSEGDLVVAQGVARRVAKVEHTGDYRGVAVTWELSGRATDGVLVAAEAPPRLERRGLGALAAIAALGVAAFSSATWLFGSAMADSARFLVERGGARPERVTRLASLASLSPWHRSKALALARDAATRTLARTLDPSAAESAVALAELGGDPASAVELLIQRGQLARAAELAEHEGLSRLAARARYLRGEFASAALDLRGAEKPTTLADALFDVRVLVFSGWPVRAAAAARLAADFADVPENPLASRADALSCLADALEGRTPETTTWRSSRGAYVECDILAADLSHKRGTPGRGLRSAIPGELASVADLLAFESDLDQQQDGLPGPEACVAVPGRAHWLDVPSDLFADRPATALALGLERTLVDRLAKTPRDCPRLEAMAASAGAFAALSGDYEGARRLVAIQARSPSAIESPITSLPAAVDFLAIGRMPDLGRREQAAWKDGASVVELLEPKAARGAGPWLPMMVSKVTSNQDRVRAWLRWGTHASCWSCQPEAITFDAARRRDAAILIGDPALAAELDATASRFRAALLERRFAVPLAVLSTL